MKIATSWSTEERPDIAAALYEKIREELGTAPDLLVLHCSVTYDAREVSAALHRCAGDIPVHGGTSCLGVMTQAGFHSENARGMGLLGLSDPDGAYGVGAADLGEDPAAAAREALSMALEQAGCAGETPAMIWMTAAPGNEELLIEGLTSVVGNNVPIAGGSAADNTVSGEWSLFSAGQVHENAVVITAMFPSSEVFFAFHSGYEPTGKGGTVTRAEGRKLAEIDGRPAAGVYNEWTGGLFSGSLEHGGNILSQATFSPLGRKVGEVAGLPYFQLSHPNAVTPDAALTLFTDIAAGDEVVLMSGTEDSLVSRVGRVASSTLRTNSAAPGEIAGALIIYCAGCMLSVQDRCDEVVQGLRDALPGVPFLGAFTFGEQGCFLGGENRHGNLMISVLLFRK